MTEKWLNAQVGVSWHGLHTHYVVYGKCLNISQFRQPQVEGSQYNPPTLPHGHQGTTVLDCNEGDWDKKKSIFRTLPIHIYKDNTYFLKNILSPSR